MSNAARKLLAIILIVWSLGVLNANTRSHAQSPSTPSDSRSGTAFKNVTALAEMPADQMGKVMNITIEQQ